MELTTLPRYQSHKIVRAAKIVSITREGANAVLALNGGLHTVSIEWADKTMPVVGGYFVVYDDGYTSFSPAKAFEEGYILIDRLDDYEGAKIDNPS